MLWLDASLADFHRLCAGVAELAEAARLRFGRLLRSESLFEDVVKMMCTCNITWRQTLAIVRRLVETYGEPAVNAPEQRAFPTPARLAAAAADDLRRGCGLGYRSDWVGTLARDVANGRLDLARLEQADLPTEELYRRLRDIRGIGDYAASSLCILLGRYDRVAVDSAMISHYRRRFPRRKPTPANIRKHYDRYAPYPALVYWWELWNHYADQTGHPESWTDGAPAERAGG